MDSDWEETVDLAMGEASKVTGSLALKGQVLSFTEGETKYFEQNLSNDFSVCSPIEGESSVWFALKFNSTEYEFFVENITKANRILKYFRSDDDGKPANETKENKELSQQKDKNMQSNLNPNEKNPLAGNLEFSFISSRDRAATMHKRRSWRNVSRGVVFMERSNSVSIATPSSPAVVLPPDKNPLIEKKYMRVKREKNAHRKSAPAPKLFRPPLQENKPNPEAENEKLKTEKIDKQDPNAEKHIKNRRKSMKIFETLGSDNKAKSSFLASLNLDYPKIDWNSKEWKFEEIVEVSDEDFSSDEENSGLTEYKPQTQNNKEFQRGLTRGRTTRGEQDSPRRQHHRANIVREILTTEQSYVQSLGICIDSYFKPLHDKAETLGELPATIASIFGNIKVLHGFNKRLLVEIEKVVESWKPSSSIGPVFIQFSPFLKMYTDYSNKFTEANEKLNQLCLKNNKFKKELGLYFKECGWKLTDLLIMPVQRIPRYSLLLKDLLNNTPYSHPDWVRLQEALKTIGDVANHVNEEVRRRENQLRLQELQTEGINLKPFIQPSRYMVKDGIIKVTAVDPFHQDGKSGELHYWVLFNDILVHCKKDLLKNVDLTDPQYRWPLSLLWITEFTHNKKQKTKLIYPKMHYIFGSKYSQWQGILSDTIQAHLATRSNHRSATSENEDQVLRFVEFRDPVTGDCYKGQWLEGVRHGLGTWEMNGNKYKGSWEKNRFSGKGRFMYNTGEEYYGYWQNGEQHGRGTLKYPDGTKCICYWSRGMRNGFGKIFFNNGDLFEGIWKKDKIHGLGSITKRCGLIYKGNWEDNLWHGKGKSTLPDNTTYEGEFQYGYKQGTGKQTYQDGSFYIGAFECDLRHGNGTFTELNGSIYSGEWKRDSKEGIGQQLYHDGSFYQGPWSNNLRHGPNGVCNYAFGATYTGDWEYDRPHGKGIFCDATGNEYKGSFARGLLDGKAEVTYTDGSKFVGFFAHGQKTKGVFTVKNHKTFPNLKSYDGEWFHGRMHGKGTITNKDGSIIKGTFVNGNLHGECTMEWNNNNTEVSKFTCGIRDGKFNLTTDGHTMNGMVISNAVNLPNIHYPIPIPPAIPHSLSVTGMEQSEAGTAQYL